MAGRMADSKRFKQNPDGSFNRLAAAQAEHAAGAYDELTKAELEEALEARDLPKTGNKADLIARLEEADAA